MREAAAAQEFERAAVLRNRLSAVRHLMERQFAHAGSVGTADVLGVALEGDSANVQVLQVRDGVLQDRQSFFLDAAGAEDEDDGAGAVRLRVLRAGAGHPAAGDGGAGERRDRGAGGAAHRPPRPPGRGARRRAGRQAQAGRAGRAQRALRPRAGPPPPRAGARPAARGAGRPPGRARPAGAAGADRVLRHLQPRRDLRGGVDGGLRGRRAGQGALPHLHHALRGRPRRLRPHARRPSRAASRRLAAPGEDDVSFAARPGLVVIDGGKGQLSAALAGIARRGGRGRAGRQPREAARGGLPARASPSRSCCRTTRRRCASSSTCATRPTASRCATTAAAAAGG